MTNSKIEKLPKLPKTILDAADNGTLAVFIGAGVSRIVGCLGWDKLTENLIDRCFTSKCQDGSQCINYKETDILSAERDHKKTISICHYILRENNLENIFYEEFEEALKPKEDLLKAQNIYDELWGLHGVFITTNADQIFHTKFKPEQIVFERFDSSIIGRNKLYHIHGLISHRESLVFTVSKYIERYRDEIFIKFLKKIFSEYTILFVGYGMNEFELLDYVIPKVDSENKKAVNRFILLPFYSGEENILGFEKSYYASMGISVIGYEKDLRGYGQLYEVIKYWNKEINQVSIYLYDSFQRLEDAANNYSEDKITEVMQLIKNDEPQRNYFFTKLASSSNPLPWLNYLVEEGYFKPEYNPPPEEVTGKTGSYIIPYWNILGYLENVAGKNEASPIQEITEQIVNIINPILDYKDNNGNRIENFRTDRSIIKIFSCLPKDRITRDYIAFIRVAIKSKWNVKLIDSEIGEILLPKLIRNETKEQVLDLLDVMLDSQEDTSAPDEYKSLIDEYWLNDALVKHKPAIAKLCGVEAATKALEIITKITDKNKIHFNNIWIPTIEDHPQTDFKDRYECQLVYFVRDMLVSSEPEQIHEIVKALLLKAHPIFKRLALHTIDRHYKDLSELFWSWVDNPLNEAGIKYELRELLKNNCKQFSEEQIDKVLGWIESRDYKISEVNKEQRDKILAYRKKEWLSALTETQNAKVIEAYKKYIAIEPEEPPHPGFDVWMETSWGRERTKVLIGIDEKTNAELAEYIKNFKPTEEWREHTLDDLRDEFRALIIDNPNRFSNDLKPFSEISRPFQYTLLSGLHEAWKAGKNYPWDEIFEFILSLIQAKEFWEEETWANDVNYRNQIIGQIADLITSGTRDDNHAFNSELLPTAENVLLILAESSKSDLTENEDILNAVLNSVKGEIFSAMVNYSLRYYRLHKNEDGVTWVKAIKDDFTKRLDKSVEPTIEFSTTVGKYLPYLYTLDKDWIKDNIDKIFPLDNAEHWKAAFTGYLFGMRQVYKDLYILLRDKGHYHNALNTEFTNRHIEERLVGHICVGYLEDWEKLEDEDSLISKLIKNDNINQVSEIISFFWMQRKDVSDRIKSKIKPLWKCILDRLIPDEDQPEYQKVISDLSKWLSLVDEIDEQIFEWLKLSIKYLETNYNSPFLIEYLLNHALTTPSKVGLLYLEILARGIFPEYKKEDIQQLVEIIYDKGEIENANRICTQYLSKGITFLQQIYEKHISKES